MGHERFVVVVGAVHGVCVFVKGLSVLLLLILSVLFLRLFWGQAVPPSVGKFMSFACYVWYV